MITDTFENLTEEIIKVKKGENAVKVDACILTFSHMILKYVLENFECKKIGGKLHRFFACYLIFLRAFSIKILRGRIKNPTQKLLMP